jgi:diguanylate cyclase (GGDEF)-like protein
VVTVDSLVSAVRARRVLHAARSRRALQPFLWLAMVWAVGALVLPWMLGTDAGAHIEATAVGVFFVALLWRLLTSARHAPDRRVALLLLGLGIALWGVGSAVLKVTGILAPPTFPSRTELLFLASYLGLAGFLLLDVPRRKVPALSVCLEASVICSAAVGSAALLVLTPLSYGFDRPGVPLLLAVIYPLIDLTLMVLVLAQVLLRQRARSTRTAMLAAGFGTLAVADSSFLLTLSSGTYTTALALTMTYGLAFAFIVSAALSRPSDVGTAAPVALGPRTLVLAAGGALVALVVAPDTPFGICVTVTSVLTLVSAGGRLVVALRDAQGATEAFRLSRTDELTDLPNRRALLTDVDAELAAGHRLSLMLLDLDGFKEINDSLGHGVGDRVLVLVADRLRSRFGHRLSLSRLGGDEFAFVVADDDEIAVVTLANDICQVVAEPIEVDDLTLHVSASMGVAGKDSDALSSTDLLRRADIAMYEAKATRCGALAYDAAHDSFSRHRLRRGEDLRRGLRQGELVMWYQPQVDAATQQVTAVEALVRWRHPQEGLLSPADFLPEARRHGLMPALSQAVVRRVVADARRWATAGHDFRVCLNLAPPEILGGLVLPVLLEATAAADLPADRLLIEVTEDSLMADPDGARARLLELRDQHIQSAIDDYGTGFSSLAYLRNLPVSELKMDRTFISTMLEDPSSRVIVHATTTMAHALGMRLVAEGVEDAATAAALIAMGVDVLQGYHIARPMPADDVDPWVRDWTASLAAGSTPLAGRGGLRVLPDQRPQVG